ncbi:type IV secretion protein Dot [Legionella nagasakiensis]|uniref:type IV secretion protein Dot n=1 Tax=Legionella nagasakiensis TaxID=535290 RepID=UPI001055D8BC|nr:type IV secretion protein Dot [Legionella nagasakiensis]
MAPGRQREIERLREETEEARTASELATREMKARLPQKSPKEFAVKSDVDNDQMIRDYMEFIKRITGKPCDKVPETVNGITKLTFPSIKDASNFFLDQAEKHPKSRFIIIDAETKTVMAYAKDGKLYHANGSEFQKGDVLTPSGIQHEDFKIPEPEETASHRPSR